MFKEFMHVIEMSIAVWLIYIQCHAHGLILVLVDSLKFNHDVAKFLDLFQSLSTFISNSNTRN